MSDLEIHRRLMEEESTRRRKMFEEAFAEAASRGKEPFDYARFLSLYRPGSAALPRPDELEYNYYVLYREIVTIEELARKQERYDECQGGDLRWD